MFCTHSNRTSTPILEQQTCIHCHRCKSKNATWKCWLHCVSTVRSVTCMYNNNKPFYDTVCVGHLHIRKQYRSTISYQVHHYLQTIIFKGGVQVHYNILYTGVPHPLWASGCTFVGHCVRQPVAQRKGRQCWYAGCSHPVGHQWCACSRQALVKMQWSSRSVYFQLSAVFMHLVDYYFFCME